MTALAKVRMTTEVDSNFEAFQKLLPELLKTHAGKFAVIRDGVIVSYCDTLKDALHYGDSVFKEDKRFSVQEVTSQNLNLGFYSYALYQFPN